MRGGWVWLVGILLGIVLLTGVVALVGDDDRRSETVSAASWADRTCGAVAVWRGEMEAIVEDIRTPTSAAGGSEEPQSETPQGRTGFVRKGLERAVSATETMVVGIERAGIPDTPQGEDAAELVSDWADDAVDELEDALDALDEEADTLEEAIEQIVTATRAVGSTLTGGIRTIAEVAQLDADVAAALQSSAICEQLREDAS